MKIPDFRSRAGSEPYTMNAGHRIAPLVAEALVERIVPTLRAGGRGQHLLDVACGPGTLSLRLARELPDAHITGVDASADMIQQAQTRAAEAGEAGLEQRVTFVTMDVHHLAFRTGSLDAAACNLGFHFFAQPVEALEEIGRVLRPGASFWSSVPDTQSWQEVFAVVHEVVPDSDRLLHGFMAKMEQAALLLPTLEQARFTIAHTEHLRLPFAFANGHDAIRFFNDLFSLFTTLPAATEARLSQALDEQFPRGVTTTYVALLAGAKWDPGTSTSAPSAETPSSRR